jgi:methyl-accepting chemotaxis protein
MKKEQVKVSFFHSIRFKLIVAFFVPIACVVALGVFSYEKASTAITEEYKNQTLQTADVLNKYVTLIIDSEKEEFKSYLVDQQLGFFIKGSLDKENSSKLVREYNDNLLTKTVVDSKVKDIYFFGPEGRSIMARSTTLAADPYETFMNSSEGAVLQEVPTDWHLFGRNDELDTAMGTHVGEYALRYVRKLGNLNGIMIIDFDAETIRGALSILDGGEGGYVAMVTRDGCEFHSDPEQDNAGIIFGQPYYETAIGSEELSGAFMVQHDGGDYLFAYSKINESGDMIAALIPQADIIAKTANIKTFTLILTLFAVIISLVLAILISGRMAHTISYILRKLKKVAAGDFTTELHAKGKDELAQLCGGVNNTIHNVKSLITKVNEVSNDVQASSDRMEEAAGTFKATSDDIKGAAGRIEDGTDRLDSNSANCLQRMDDLSGIITEVTENTEEITRFTKETEATIQEGIASVKSLTDSSDATSRITEEVITAIKELEAKLEAVHDVVKTINGIAKKTNLLSLNAGIEAARAGEAGRGFTVVAEEIRNLSTQCMESADRIGEIVDDVASKTGDVVKTAGKAEDVVAMQADVVEKTRESFNTISKQVSGFIESLDTICEHVEQMDGARAETLSSIEGISQISGETVERAGDVTRAAEQQEEAIDDLEDASRQLKARSEELIKILGEFQI